MRAKDSAGKRLGTAGTNIGDAPLQWACSEAAALFLRHHPAGPKRLARLAHHQGTGNALTLLAHRLARAVDPRRDHHIAFAREQCLHRYGSRAGEPDASLDTPGIRLHRACAQSCATAAVTAEVRLGRVSRRLGPLLGPPLWLLN